MCGTAAIVSSVSIKGKRWVPSSVVDPDPDPWDPYVWSLPDLDPSLFCTDLDPSINKQKSEKYIDFYYFVTSF
jgi:hypothetical protein